MCWATGRTGVSVTKTNPAGEQQYFPLSFDIAIPPGGNAVAIRVPLARIGGAITGDVVAVNTAGQRVQPPPLAIVSDAYDQADPDVSGATASNIGAAPTVPDTTAVAPVAGSPPITPWTYNISELGSGSHVLTFKLPTDATVAAAYTAPTATQQLTVLGPFPNAPTTPCTWRRTVRSPSP